MSGTTACNGNGGVWLRSLGNTGKTERARTKTLVSDDNDDDDNLDFDDDSDIDTCSEGS